MAAVNQLTHDLARAPLYHLPARAERVAEPMAHGSLELNLLPLRSQRQDVVGASLRGLKRLAQKNRHPP